MSDRAAATGRLTTAEAERFAVQLRHALGSGWRVDVFALGWDAANLEVRPARPPMRPATILRTVREAQATLVEWIAQHGAPPPLKTPRRWWPGPYANAQRRLGT